MACCKATAVKTAVGRGIGMVINGTVQRTQEQPTSSQLT